MAFGIEEIRKEIKGTFTKFYFMVTVTRTKKNENLYKCFSENNNQTHIYKSFAYARNINDMCMIIAYWQRQDPAYKYRLLPSQVNKPKQINEVIEDFYNENKPFKNVIHHIFLNGTYEIIH